MKKRLRLLAICSIAALSASAQSHLSLYEEFTGENCFTCAAVNPGVQSLVGFNNASVVQLTYVSPLPVAGPLYTGYYHTPTDSRISYYGISSVPQGRLNGTGLGTGTAFNTPGHAGNLTQADIDAAGMTTTPFNISVSHAYFHNGDSIMITVGIASPGGYAGASGTALRLRVALAENLSYPAAPPGINGEQTFPNVVRQMYPSAAGTALPATWTTGQSTTLTIRGDALKYEDKTASGLIVWIQNDATKSILQAAVSMPVAIPLDAGIAASRPPQKLICAAGNAGVPHNTVLRNSGTSTITSARIYYRADGGSPLLYNWSGSLGPGSATTVALPALSVGGGNHTITDSAVLPNGVTDINTGNNVAYGRVNIYNTNPQRLPIASGFEGNGGAIPAGWVLYDADSNGRGWAVTKNIFGGPAGYGGSTYFLLHNNYYVPAGETNYAILPAVNLPNGTRTLDFVYAHAQFASENDALDVVYSTDCGVTWTSAWTASGAALSTAPATTAYFIPTASQWAAASVDLTALPSNAMIAFRAVSDYGNSLYLDNIQLSSPVGVNSGVVHSSSLRVYPNPAPGAAFADYNLVGNGPVRIVIIDALGREQRSITQPAGAGRQHVALPTDGLPAGMYTLRIADAVTRLLIR